MYQIYMIHIVSKNGCVYCTKLKELLDEYRAVYMETNLDSMDLDEAAMREYILGLGTGCTTVPQLFVGGAFYGGYSKAKGAHDAGILADILTGEDMCVIADLDF